MRKVLSILFLTLFSFQLLPIKQIGKILWNGTMTEEVHEHGPFHKKLAGDDHNKSWYHCFSTALNIGSKHNADFEHAHRDEALIKCLHLDVPVQPPNFG